MLSWLWTFFSDLLYWIAVVLTFTGAGLYIVSYLVKFLPMLKPQALIMQVAGVVLVISGGYYVSDHHGYQRRMDEDQVEIDRLNTEARAKEAQLDKQKQVANVALRKAKDAIQSKQTIINSRIDAGELRLPTSCPVQASSDSGSTGGAQANASDAERQTIKALADIAADGDRAIESLNACISFYNEVKDKVNVKP
jgi:hypothetical protein